MSEVALFWSCKRQQQLLGLIRPFDGLTLSSGISCSARVPILQQLLHNSFGRLQILACHWPRLVHNAVLTNAKKKIKIDILEEKYFIPYIPFLGHQPADPNLTNCWHAELIGLPATTHLDTTEFELRTVPWQLVSTL
jgi:hypothetical protein